ncbi:putative SVOP protein [Danaus plexippus plexippus]|uniref:SVOP protein n=1 Tax=Danaus plexippus plexippus TaxID=278856 RepID=A0A212EWK7_DANPL|nr:putative SVOP protein [Danaus plexippus plexippus]
MRRSKGYQDLDENVGDGRQPAPPMPPPQEIEMASVSVVPDDTFTVTQAVNALGFGWFQVKLSLYTGLCWMADSMEMTILSILSPALHCEWNISKYQQALTTTVVFMGMMLSSTFWGNISDRYGRKTALSMCGVLLFYYGLLSAIAPNFLWLLFLRGLVGFAIGCCFWALGACLEVALALVVMPTLGVHWLLALSTVPLLIFALICPWLPESARFHVASGQPDKALATLDQIARDNGRPMLLGRLVCDDSVGIGQRGRLKHLLIPQLRNTSLLLWVIWMSCAFCYYGLVLMTTELFETDAGEEPCAADCRPLQTTDYMDLLWTTLAEFPGIFATIFIIEKFGRKKTMASQFVIFAMCVCVLTYNANRTFLTCTLFLARGIIAGLFQAAYVYTPETYLRMELHSIQPHLLIVNGRYEMVRRLRPHPEPFADLLDAIPVGQQYWLQLFQAAGYNISLRSTAVGACSGVARLGAMVTPYVAQVLLRNSVLIATAVYSVAALLAAAACLALPIETKGREMKDTVTVTG